jgi:hypothetical protein
MHVWAKPIDAQATLLFESLSAHRAALRTANALQLDRSYEAAASQRTCFLTETLAGVSR